MQQAHVSATANHRSTAPDPLGRIERLSGRAIESSEGALIGDRAGITEWANARWMDITGFTSLETLGKPVTHVLAESEVDPEVPAFIQSHFEAGRRCVVSLPFDRRDGASLSLQLEVIPELDADGEPRGFVALLQDVSMFSARECDHSAPTPGPAPTRWHGTGRVVSVSECAAAAARRIAAKLPATIAIDDELLPDLRAAAQSASELEENIHSLMLAAREAMDETWGTLSLSTGRAEPGVPLRSATYRTSFFGTCHERDPFAFVEIHDTAPALSPEECIAMRKGIGSIGEGAASSRTRRLLRTRARIEAAGGQLHVASALGAGTRVLLLLPIA